MHKKSFYLAVVILLISASVLSMPDQNKATIAVEGDPVAVAVHPDDRWVFIASQGTTVGTIYFLDTITWSISTTSKALLSGQPVDMAVSLDGSKLYVTDTTGFLNQLDLSPLSTYKLGDTLTITSKRCQVDDNSLGDIAVAPEPDLDESATTQYIIVGVPDGGTSPTIRVFRQTEINSTTSATCPVFSTASTSGAPKGIAAGLNPSDTLSPVSYLGHAAIDVSTGGGDIHNIFSFSSPGTLNTVALDGVINTYIPGDIVVDAAGGAAFIHAENAGAEFLFKQTGSAADNWAPAGTITLSAQNRDVSLAITETDPGRTNADEIIYVAATGPTATESDISLYHADTLIAVSTVVQTSGDTLSDIAASSPGDGYVYSAAAVSGVGKLHIITENPWLSNVTFTPVENDGISNTTVSFTSDSAGTLFVFKGDDITPGTPELFTNTITAGTITFTLSADQLTEGNNTILLLVTDAKGDTGRIGKLLVKDTVPEAVTFDVGFGEQALFVTIHTLNDPDITSYVVFYSTDINELTSDPPTSSSVSLTNFTANSDASVAITGLTNGATYYVRVRAVDATHNGVLSEIKSAIPQQTLSLSELKGESGCMMSKSDSPGAGFIAIAGLFIAFLIAIRFGMRRFLTQGHKGTKIIKTLCLCAFVSSLFLITTTASYAKQKTEPRETSPVHFSFSARGGLFFPEDADFRRIYGKWTNDIYYLEFGWYPFRNFYVQTTAGFYYEPSNTLGSITPVLSSENLDLWFFPLEVGLGYRFNFWKNQIVVPYIGAGYDYVYFNEDSDPGDTTEGWKNGWAVNGGLLILLDRFEPRTAWRLFEGFGIDNSYFDIGARYNRIGENDGLNLSGPVYLLGLLFEF